MRTPILVQPAHALPTAEGISGAQVLLTQFPAHLNSCLKFWELAAPSWHFLWNGQEQLQPWPPFNVTVPLSSSPSSPVWFSILPASVDPRLRPAVHTFLLFSSSHASPPLPLCSSSVAGMPYSCQQRQRQGEGENVSKPT